MIIFEQQQKDLKGTHFALAGLVQWLGLGSDRRVKGLVPSRGNVPGALADPQALSVCIGEVTNQCVSFSLPSTPSKSQKKKYSQVRKNTLKKRVQF